MSSYYYTLTTGTHTGLYDAPETRGEGGRGTPAAAHTVLRFDGLPPPAVEGRLVTVDPPGRCGVRTAPPPLATRSGRDGCCRGVNAAGFALTRHAPAVCGRDASGRR